MDMEMGFIMKLEYTTCYFNNIHICGLYQNFADRRIWEKGEAIR